MHTIAAQVTHNLLWCRESMWTPTVDHKKCIGCGVQRLSAWYHKGTRPTGLYCRCKPCTALYAREMSRKCRQARDSKDPVTTKMCRGCYLTLPADRFVAAVRNTDGYTTKCRNCRQVENAAKSRERLERSRNQTLVFAKGTERICSRCRGGNPWDEFYKRIYSTSSIVLICKQCHNTKQLQRSIFRKLQVQSNRL